MPILRDIARRKRKEFFLARIPQKSRILEVGSGSGWVKDELRDLGQLDYTGLDIVGPAEIVGDIKRWKELGLKPESFDTVLAFEVLEHVECRRECFDLLKPGGMLMLTTPVPHMDWALKILETLGLNQRRTSPHDNLVTVKPTDDFTIEEFMTFGFLGQWVVLRKRSSGTAGSLNIGQNSHRRD